MKSIVKKIGSVICLSAIALSVSVMGVSAKNASDTNYNFDFGGIGNKEQYTNARAKEDTSYLYIHCSSSNGEFTAEPFAYDKNGRHFDSRSSEKLVRKGSTRALTNYVRENGYNQAGIHGYRDYWVDVVSSGVWSPDSTPFTDKY